MFDSIQRRVRDYLRSLVPTRSITRWDSAHAEPFAASSLDVTGLHTAMRSAESGDVRQLFAIYRDTVLADNHVQSEFGKRKLAIIGDTFSILPADKNRPQDKEAAATIEHMVESVPGWNLAISHLMDSVLWPVSVVEKIYRPAGSGFHLAALIPVPHELLDFQARRLRIHETDSAGRPIHSFHDPDPERYIIHRNHLLTTPDHWGGPMRSILFWWLLGAMDRDWWARYLDRYGSPFLVGKYSQADDESRSMLERAFSLAVKIGGLVISEDTSVDIQQASTQSAGEAFELFYTISRREISKLIVGQTLSAESQSTGLGSGVASAHAEVRDDYRKFDAKILGETLRDQVFKPFLAYNGIHAGIPKISWGSVSASEAKATGELLVSISTAGLRVADTGLDALSDRIGLPIERSASANPQLTLPQAFSILSASLPASRLARADAALDSIAREGSADLARAFRGRLAPIRQIILDSTGPDDLQRRLESFQSAEPGRAALLIEEALMAYAANGAAR